MTVFEILHKLILGPIELLFDVIFSCSIQFLGSPGLSIIVLSLAVNLLVLPLYKKADSLQKEEQEITARLRPRVKRIRKAFSGDERFMILQTYYRQNNYKPYYVLRGSLSLLLQIPFFIVAYRFLSDLTVLKYVPFGPIENLAEPDGLLKLGGITVNVLPVLMTAINIVSGMIYTKGQPLKSRIQLYGMAIVFLILLYNSPAALVFYWTLNNIFSLGKNILGSLLKKRTKETERKEKNTGNHTALFFAGCMLLTVLTGLLIPSALIHDSPAEFVEMNAFRSPLVYVLHAFLLAAGTFIIWSSIYYFMMEKKKRSAFCAVFAFLSLAAVVNYMFFGNGYGNMTSRLVYDTDIGENISSSQILINAGVLLAMASLVFFLWRKKAAVLRAACILMAFVITGMAVVNIISVGSSLPEIERLAAQRQAEKEEIIHLDKKGKNVVVLMLDRACGLFSPYIFAEKPELKEQYEGFVCYLNTLSYGNATHNGSPGLFGGYEYTAANLCKRTESTLLEKQNEALRLMPAIFVENGYEVTVCDPPLANYGWIPDLSIFDDLPRVRAYHTMGTYAGDSLDESKEGIAGRNRAKERNFFCYSVLRAAPVLLHRKLYEGGNYNRTEKETGDYIYFDNYQVMKKLPQMTLAQAEGSNTFLMMTSKLTHEAEILQEPEYEPAQTVDNTQYDLEHPSRFSEDGNELLLSTDTEKEHYHVNMAAMLLIGKWLDFLRESGVYDNTRIILVSDHGMLFGYPEMCSEEIGLDIANFNSLLMVKDFGSREPFTFSDEFMTNADTPTLAFSGLIENPVNPATGVPVRDDEKQNNEQVICKCRGNFEGDEETVFPRATYYVLKNHVVMNLENWSVMK